MPGTYLVIAADEQGTLHVRDSFDPLAEFVDHEIGVGGRGRVHLARDWQDQGIAAYVNDSGLLMDEHPRNVIGSCALAAMGANQQPYAGPVVLLGWDYTATAHGQLEPRPMRDQLVDGVRRLLTAIRAVVLHNQVPADSPGPDWADEIRLYADLARNADPGPILMLNAEESAAALRRMGL